MQFVTYPSSDNLARLIVLPGDLVPGYTNGTYLVNGDSYPGGMDGNRHMNFELIMDRLIAWCTIPLALFYDYYRLGSMLAGAAPQNLLVNLLVSGAPDYQSGGLTTDMSVSAYFVNIGDDLGSVPVGITPFVQTLNVSPLSTAGVLILQKMVMGQMYLNPGQADTSDGLLILKIERLVAGNTYGYPVYLHALTIDMGIKR